MNSAIPIVRQQQGGNGAGIAKELAARGAKAAVNYSGSKAAAENVAAEITAARGTAIAVQVSLADAARRRLQDAMELRLA